MKLFTLWAAELESCPLTPRHIEQRSRALKFCRK